MPKRAYLNGDPEAISPGAPPDMVKVEFARRLQHLMTERGFNQSELARRAAEHTSNGRFGRDNISNYIRGVSLPSPIHMRALVMALGCQSSELMPTRGMPKVDDRLPSFDMRKIGDSAAWIRMNREVSWQAALEIARLIS